MKYFFNFSKLAYVKGKKPRGCILCLIAAGSSSVEDLTVFEDDLFIVCVNLYPYNPGHLMVFPRRHILDIRQYTEAEQTRLAELTRHTLDVLDQTHSPAGFNIGYNMGPVAGASIRHVHCHVIPRYKNETGISDVIAGRRVLVESPLVTRDQIRAAFEKLKLDR